MLDGAKFVCLNENGDPYKTIEAKGRKFSIGYLMDCDHIIGDNEEAEKIHCQIECDAFGHITISNKSDKNPIIVNGETVTLKRTLFNNSKIRILDKQYLWQHKTTACNVDLVSKNPEETPVKVGIPEQPPSSCPTLRHHRDLPQRFTMHNLRAYRVDSDANVTMDNDESNQQHEKSSSVISVDSTESSDTSEVTDASAVTSTTPLRTQLTAASGLRKQALLASAKKQVPNNILATPHSPETPSNLSLPLRNTPTTATPLTTMTKPISSSKIMHSAITKDIKSQVNLATTKKNPVIRKLDISLAKRTYSPVSKTSEIPSSTTVFNSDNKNLTATKQISIEQIKEKDFSMVAANDESSILTTSTPYKTQTLTVEAQKQTHPLDAAVELFNVLHSSNDEKNSLEKDSYAVSQEAKDSCLNPTEMESSKSKESITKTDDLMKEIEEILSTSDELRKQLQTAEPVAENEYATEEVEEDNESTSRTSSKTPVPSEIETTAQTTTPTKNSLSASILLKAINSIEKNKPKMPKEDEEKENKVNECISTPVRRRISLSTAGPSIPTTPAITEELSIVTAGTPLTPKRVTKRRPSISLDTDEVAAAHISHRLIDTYNTENMGAIIEEETEAVPLIAEQPEPSSSGSMGSENISIKLSTHPKSDAKEKLETTKGQHNEDKENALSDDRQAIDKIDDESMSPLYCSDESFAEPVNCEDLEESPKESVQVQSKTISTHEINTEDEMLDESFGEIEHKSLETANNVTIKETLVKDDKKKDAAHFVDEHSDTHNLSNVTFDERCAHEELIGYNAVTTTKTAVQELKKDDKNRAKLTTEDTIEILDSSFETSVKEETEMITSNIDKINEESEKSVQQTEQAIIDVLDSSVEDNTKPDKLCTNQLVASAASPQLFEVDPDEREVNTNQQTTASTLSRKSNVSQSKEIDVELNETLDLCAETVVEQIDTVLEIEETINMSKKTRMHETPDEQHQDGEDLKASEITPDVFFTSMEADVVEDVELETVNVIEENENAEVEKNVEPEAVQSSSSEKSIFNEMDETLKTEKKISADGFETTDIQSVEAANDNETAELSGMEERLALNDSIECANEGFQLQLEEESDELHAIEVTLALNETEVLATEIMSSSNEPKELTIQKTVEEPNYENEKLSLLNEIAELSDDELDQPSKVVENVIETSEAEKSSITNNAADQDVLVNAEEKVLLPPTTVPSIGEDNQSAERSNELQESKSQETTVEVLKINKSDTNEEKRIEVSSEALEIPSSIESDIRDDSITTEKLSLLNEIVELSADELDQPLKVFENAIETIEAEKSSITNNAADQDLLVNAEENVLLPPTTDPSIGEDNQSAEKANELQESKIETTVEVLNINNPDTNEERRVEASSEALEIPSSNEIDVRNDSKTTEKLSLSNEIVELPDDELDQPSEVLENAIKTSEAEKSSIVTNAADQDVQVNPEENVLLPPKTAPSIGEDNQSAEKANELQESKIETTVEVLNINKPDTNEERSVEVSSEALEIPSSNESDVRNDSITTEKLSLLNEIVELPDDELDQPSEVLENAIKTSEAEKASIVTNAADQDVLVNAAENVLLPPTTVPSIGEDNQSAEKANELQESKSQETTVEVLNTNKPDTNEERSVEVSSEALEIPSSNESDIREEENQQYLKDVAPSKIIAEELISARDDIKGKEIVTVDSSKEETKESTEMFEADSISYEIVEKEVSTTLEANEVPESVTVDIEAEKNKTCEKQGESPLLMLDKEHRKQSQLLEETALDKSSGSSVCTDYETNSLRPETTQTDVEMQNEVVKIDKINETKENSSQCNEKLSTKVSTELEEVSIVEANEVQHDIIENLPDLILDLNKEKTHEMKRADSEQQIEIERPMEDSIVLTEANTSILHENSIRNVLKTHVAALDGVEVESVELKEQQDIVESLNEAEKSEEELQQIQIAETKEADEQKTPQETVKKLPDMSIQTEKVPEIVIQSVHSNEIKESEEETAQAIAEKTIDAEVEKKLPSEEKIQIIQSDKTVNAVEEPEIALQSVLLDETVEKEPETSQKIAKSNEAVEKETGIVEEHHKTRENRTEVLPNELTDINILTAEEPSVHTVHSNEIKETEQIVTQEVVGSTANDITEKQLSSAEAVEEIQIEETKHVEKTIEAVEKKANITEEESQAESQAVHADVLNEDAKMTNQPFDQELHLDGRQDDRQAVENTDDVLEKLPDLDKEHHTTEIPESVQPDSLVDKDKETKRRPTKIETKERKPRRERQVRAVATKVVKTDQQSTTCREQLEESGIVGEKSDLQTVKESQETIKMDTAVETVVKKAANQEIIQKSTPSETKERKPRRLRQGRAVSTVEVNKEEENIAENNHPTTKELAKTNDKPTTAETSEVHQTVEVIADAKKPLAKQKSTKDRKPRRGKQAEVVLTKAESAEEETREEIEKTAKDPTEEGQAATQKQDSDIKMVAVTVPVEETKTLEALTKTVQSFEQKEKKPNQEKPLDSSTTQRSLRRRAAVQSYEISSDSEQETPHSSSSSRKKRVVKNTPKQASKTASFVETEKTATSTEHISAIDATATLEISAAGKLQKEKNPKTVRARRGAKKAIKLEEETTEQTDESEHIENVTQPKAQQSETETESTTRPASRRGAKKVTKITEEAEHVVAEEVTVAKPQKRTTARKGKNAKIEEIKTEMESLKDDESHVTNTSTLQKTSLQKHAAEEIATSIESQPKTIPKRKGRLLKTETITEKSDANTTADTAELLPTKRRRRQSVQSELVEQIPTSAPPTPVASISSTRKPRTRRVQHVEEHESALTTDATLEAETASSAKTVAGQTEDDNDKKPRVGRRGKQANVIEPVVIEKRRKQTKTTTHESDEEQEKVVEILQIESSKTSKTTRGRHAKQSESSEVVTTTTSRRNQTKAQKAKETEKADDNIEEEQEPEVEVEVEQHLEENAAKKTRGKRQKQVELSEVLETTKTVRSQRRKHVHFNEEPADSVAEDHAKTTEAVVEESSEAATVPKRRRRR